MDDTNANFNPSNNFGTDVLILFTSKAYNPIAMPVNVPKIPKDDKIVGKIYLCFGCFRKTT